MFSFSIILIVVDILFLSLGALLLIYSQEFGLIIPKNPDMLFPNIALNSGNPWSVDVTQDITPGWSMTFCYECTSAADTVGHTFT